MGYTFEKNDSNETYTYHIGEVLFVNVRTRSAQVLDENNNKLVEVPLTLPSTLQNPNIGFYDVEFLIKEGTRVKLAYHANSAYIIGIVELLDQNIPIEDRLLRRKITNVNNGEFNLDGIVADNIASVNGYSPSGDSLVGSEDKIYSKHSKKMNSYASNAFEDMMPGDKVIATKDGNLIAVLEGGVTYFKASELCQIIANKYDDLLRIVSRNFEHFTDFGNILVKNVDGRTSYIMQGAKSQGEARLGRYNLLIEAGADGDAYKISVTDGVSKVLGQIHMQSDGSIRVKTLKNYSLDVYGDYTENIHGVQKRNVQKNYEIDYTADYKKAVHGNESNDITGNKTVTTNGDETSTVGGSVARTFGGTIKESIRGDLLFGDALKQSIFVGNKSEQITTKGDFERNILINGSYKNSTTLGNFEDSTLSGDHKRDTLKGDISDTTTIGNIKRSASLGNIEDTVNVGDYKLNVTGGGINLKNDTVEIDVTTSGNITITNPQIELTIDGLTGKVKLDTPGDLDLAVGGDIKVGEGATEKAVLGSSFATFFNSHIHPTGVGPSGPPTSPMTQLSSTVTIKD